MEPLNAELSRSGETEEKLGYEGGKGEKEDGL
jgi:hypothetical protein